MPNLKCPSMSKDEPRPSSVPHFVTFVVKCSDDVIGSHTHNNGSVVTDLVPREGRVSTFKSEIQTFNGSSTMSCLVTTYFDQQNCIVCLRCSIHYRLYGGHGQMF